MSTKGRSSPSGPTISEKITATFNLAAGGGANTCVTVTATVTGVRTTDTVTVNVPAGLSDSVMVVGANVPSDDVVAVRVANPTAVGVTLTTADLDLTIGKFST